jgi:hypothetical protein
MKSNLISVVCFDPEHSEALGKALVRVVHDRCKSVETLRFPQATSLNPQLSVAENRRRYLAKVANAYGEMATTLNKDGAKVMLHSEFPEGISLLTRMEWRNAQPLRAARVAASQSFRPDLMILAGIEALPPQYRVKIIEEASRPEWTHDIAIVDFRDGFNRALSGATMSVHAVISVPRNYPLPPPVPLRA